MKKYQIWAIIRHEWEINFKSKMFWMIVLLPIILICLFLLRYQESILNLSTKTMLVLINQLVPLVIFCFCSCYTSILANEIINDKSSRVSEIILSIVDGKTQIVGKFLGILSLLICHIMLYLIIIFALSKSLGLDIIEDTILKQGKFFTLLVISMFLTLIACLIWTTEIGIFINDKEQTFLAVMPAMFLTGQATLFSWYLVLNSGTKADLITHILFDIPACIPAIGSVFMVTLVSSFNFSYVEAYITEAIQALFLCLMLKRAIKNYKVGSISKRIVFRNWFR